MIFHILTAFKRNRCSVEKELCRVVGLISSRDEGVFPSCDTARVAGKTPRGAALQSNLPSGLLYETHVCEAGLHVCTTRSERSSFNCPLTRSISFPVFSGKLFGFQMRFSRLTAQWSRLSGLRCDSVFYVNNSSRWPAHFGPFLPRMCLHWNYLSVLLLYHLCSAFWLKKITIKRLWRLDNKELWWLLCIKNVCILLSAKGMNE